MYRKGRISKCGVGGKQKWSNTEQGQSPEIAEDVDYTITTGQVRSKKKKAI